MANDSSILPLYLWVSSMRFTGASPQETHILLGQNAENAHAYKAYQHMQRAEVRTYKALSFPERYIEEVEVIAMTLNEARIGTFTIRPQTAYALDRMRFKYIEGLCRRYHIRQETQDAPWRYQPADETGDDGVHSVGHATTEKKVLAWNATQQQWDAPVTSLPWFATPFRGKIISIPLPWPSDPGKLAFVVATEQGTMQVGAAQAVTHDGRIHPIAIAEMLIGTLDAAPLMQEDNQEEHQMAFARVMATWANTTTVLALLEGVPRQEAANLAHITQR